MRPGFVLPQEELRAHCTSVSSDNRSEDFILVLNSSQGTAGYDMEVCVTVCLPRPSITKPITLMLPVVTWTRAEHITRVESVRKDEWEQLSVATAWGGGAGDFCAVVSKHAKKLYSWFSREMLLSQACGGGLSPWGSDSPDTGSVCWMVMWSERPRWGRGQLSKSSVVFPLVEKSTVLEKTFLGWHGLNPQ